MVKRTNKHFATETEKIQFEGGSDETMALGRNNFIGMAIAGVLIVVGFLLMLGAPSGIDEFNPDIFSTRRIVVGPCIAFVGFVAMGAAIIIRPNNYKKD